MSKALILWASRMGATTNIGNLIAEGLRIAGCEVDVRDVKYIKSEDELVGYDAVVLGSATYHGEMMQPMKTFLFMAEKADLKNAVGGAFGAFGWSGEAPDRIFDTMKHIFQMKMVKGPLRLKSATVDGAIKMAQDYGKEIAALVGSDYRKP
jgi:flavorubredoxin